MKLTYLHMAYLTLALAPICLYFHEPCYAIFFCVVAMLNRSIHNEETRRINSEHLVARCKDKE